MTISELEAWDNWENPVLEAFDSRLLSGNRALYSLSVAREYELNSLDWVNCAPERNVDPCIIENRQLVFALEESGYIVSEDLDTWDFLVRHEPIVEKLHLAIPHLRKAMQADLSPRLRGDRDEDGHQLLVLVPPYPAENLEHAMNRLDGFCDQWWDENMTEYGLTVLISIG